MMNKLLETHAHALRHISIVGFSAGGQLVQRYAGVSKAYARALAANVSVSFSVMSASSYMRLDDLRPSGT